jgi:NAD(P)-dependent dehydrogenase (short-subunit alcohol dehydrogenase family)
MTKRTALVTGAGGGLGHAMVERLVANGWKVFAADINKDALRSSMHDPDVLPVVVDVTDRESIRSAYEAVSSNTDRLDGLVNFAGIMGVGSLTDIPEERLARILDVNVMGTYRINKKFLPLVEAAQGRIVNISSETGWQSAAPFNGPYAMSKYAIEAYSTSLRRELALLGIKVITVQPGPFRTDMVAGIERAFSQAEEESSKFASVLGALKGLAAKQINSAHDPDILAQAIEGALTAKRPKPVYSVKPDRLRSTLERLPLRAVDQAYLAVTRRAYKRATD